MRLVALLFVFWLKTLSSNVIVSLVASSCRYLCAISSSFIILILFFLLLYAIWSPSHVLRFAHFCILILISRNHCLTYILFIYELRDATARTVLGYKLHHIFHWNNATQWEMNNCRRHTRTRRNDLRVMNVVQERTELNLHNTQPYFTVQIDVVVSRNFLAFGNWMLPNHSNQLNIS